MQCRHAMRFGATLHERGTTFRLWAPAAKQVDLLLPRPGGTVAVAAEAAGDGWHEVERRDAEAGERYQWRIDGGLVVPDPASRSNPQGPHGPSVVVDPCAFEWEDAQWSGRPWHDAVFYELHVGTFTPEGSFDAAIERLPALAELGITAIQLMPLADFPGRFGWGYDGVLPFAPYHGYGSPEALKRLVQSAHRLGLMVFADVVYNHFGPDGNYLQAYAPSFFSQRHRTAWGAGINFDGDASATVRRFFIDNALYWLHEFRFDGLRLDAVHAMRDDSRPDILQALSVAVRTAFPGRHVHLVLENDANDETRLAPRPESGLYDGQWSGDVHHALHVLLTGERDGYYAEYDAPVAQLGRALAHGFARQGGPHNAEGAAPRRAAEADAPLAAIVNLLQNHDQVGNRAFGERLHTLAEPAALKLAAAIVMLAPSPPLLFMGEEDGSQTPFMYFADWQGELRDAVRRGREQEFAHFPRYAAAAREGRLPDPCSRETFERCKLAAIGPNEWRTFYRTLLALRAREIRPLLPRLQAGGHAAAHDGSVLQVRWHFRFDDSRTHVLCLHANLAPTGSAAIVPPVEGPPLMTLGDVGPAWLGAWSARWHWLRSTV